jgi:hypothetical protein
LVKIIGCAHKASAEPWACADRYCRLGGGVFKSVAELQAAIEQYLETHNADPRPFVWTASAITILEKVSRGRQTLESVH